jgi:restriction system protein
MTNDGGIDGVIDQDTLGLSRVYVQAKRYSLDTRVQRPETQGFVGALSGKASSGVFITTGRFSSGACQLSGSIPTHFILIDGERLASLMIRFGVGVQVRQSVNIVEIDEDFFE